MDHFENQYKKSMEGYRPEVDTENIWKNIEPRLHPKKKRRFFLIWWLAVLIPGFLGAWYLQSKENGSKVVFHNSNEPAASIKQSTQQDFKQSGSADGASATMRPVGAMDAPQTPMVLGAQNNILKEAKIIADRASYPSDTSNPGPQEVAGSESKNSEWHSTLEQLLSREVELTHISVPLKFPKNSTARGIKSHRPKWTPWIHAQAGLGITNKSLQSRPEIRDGGNSLSDRTSTEKMLESVSGNVQWLMQHQNGFQTFLGIQYTLSNEKYRLAYQTTEQRTNIETIEKVVDGNGQVIEEKPGLVTTTIKTNYSKTTYNKYHFIDVPLGVGYARAKGRSWWAYAGGIGLNLFMSFRGEQASGYGYTYLLSKGTSTYSSVYKNAVGWNAWMRVQYNWRLRPDAFLFANVQTQIPFSSVTVEDYSLSQKHFQIGANAGVQIPLKKIKPKK